MVGEPGGRVGQNLNLDGSSSHSSSISKSEHNHATRDKASVFRENQGHPEPRNSPVEFNSSSADASACSCSIARLSGDLKSYMPLPSGASNREDAASGDFFGFEGLGVGVEG